MDVVITIDTEEDNWRRYSTTDNPVTNIEQLPRLQELFDRFGAKPTYLINYPVATTEQSVATLRTMLEQGKCEIGMHCHPWNTPPFEETISPFNSMLCNLDAHLVERKLVSLYNAISQNFGTAPRSFRSGRWGFGPAVAKVIQSLGILVDTSVTPLVDWSDPNWSNATGPDYTNFPFSPYRFNPGAIDVPVKDGSLLEVPASIGFLQKNFARCRKLFSTFNRSGYKKLHLPGIAERLGWLNRVWLSPEEADGVTLVKFAHRLAGEGSQVMNLNFHSTTMVPGLTPFVESSIDLKIFLSRIEQFLTQTVNSGYCFRTLAELERIR